MAEPEKPVPERRDSPQEAGRSVMDSSASLPLEQRWARREACWLAGELAKSRSALVAARARSLELQNTVRQTRVTVASLNDELAAIKASTLWRVLILIRSVLLKLPPPVRSWVRRGLKVLWWLATPWRLPARLHLIRQHQGTGRSASVQKSGTTTQTSPAPDGSSADPPATATSSARMEPASVGRALQALTRFPSFSLVVALREAEPALLARMISSVQEQWYPHWELIMVVDPGTTPFARRVLDELEDPRIQFINLPEHKPVADAVNEGIAAAEGLFIAFLGQHDEISPDCLYELAVRIDRDDHDYLYSDEDQIDSDGIRSNPFFKPDWSPDTMMSVLLAFHVACVRRSLVTDAGGMRSEYEGEHDWDFALRATERATKIGHVPMILYHRRSIPNQIIAGVIDCENTSGTGKRAREDALRRRGLSGELVPVPELPGIYRTRYHLRGRPKFSIIIPSKNNGVVLNACIDSILARTTYTSFEVLVVNNGSTDAAALACLDSLRSVEKIQILDHDVPFNYSEINNFGVRHANGDVLVFLNDDTEVLSGDWLETMGGFAQLPHVGAVGAKLLYPGGATVQHGGVLNLTPGLRHAFPNAPSRLPGYFARNMVEYNWIAVTGACLMIEREKFDMAGGFDEDLAVTYNDIALCFSLGERGFYQVVCPGVELIHHESLSRGNDSLDAARMARLDRERHLLFGKHPAFRRGDPFFNPNLVDDDPHFRVR